MTDIIEKYSFPTPNGGRLLSTQALPNGNMAGATAQWLFLMPISYSGAFEFADGLNYLMPYRGIVTRDGHTNSQIDDYLAVACLRTCAGSILYRTRKTWGFLDFNSPYKPSWDWTQFIYRWPYFGAHVRMSAGLCVGPMGRFFWALYIAWVAFQPVTNQDSWIESSLMILVAERRGYRSFIGELAKTLWRHKKAKPTSEIMKDYLDLQEHPLITAWEKYTI